MSRKLSKPKRCGCGVIYLEVPEVHVWDPRYEMFHWQCACQSSLAHAPDIERMRALIRAEYDAEQRLKNA